MKEPQAVIVGAGIAGASAAYYLTLRGVNNVKLIDSRPPMTLTSANSTECYRNFFPQGPLVELTNHSIDLLRELSVSSSGAFRLTDRGYLFVTGSVDQLSTLVVGAESSSSFGAGPVRYRHQPGTVVPETLGFDVYDSTEAVLSRFPYLTPDVAGALHVRNAGWLSAHQLGMWMIEVALDRGAELIRGEVTGVNLEGDRLRAVRLASGQEIDASVLILASGPSSKVMGEMVGLDLPLRGEVHHQVTFRDHLGLFPLGAPMLIWCDPQTINWAPEERNYLRTEGHQSLLQEIRVAPYARPDLDASSPYFHGLWEYRELSFEYPGSDLPAPDGIYPEVVLRGLSTMIPSLATYQDRLPSTTVDGGFVVKTPENLPLIGPAGPGGCFLLAGLSGYGVMVSAAAGDLISRHVTGMATPPYASVFLPSRYDDPNYLEPHGVVDTGELSKKAASPGHDPPR